ncbi:MAG: protein DA1 [Anaerolineae bacterium]
MLTCAGCRKPITLRYTTALNQTWHADCFRCAGCGKPIGLVSYLVRDDRPYHAACYHDRFSPRCAGCGRPIVGTFTTAQGKTWHPEHFLCAGGREPINGRSFHEHEGKAYCDEHYWQKFGKRCAIGGEILKGAYQVNAWGDNYCAAHARGLTDCFSCHRPICQPLTGGGTRYTDGREMCGLCRRTAIDELHVGEGILKEVRAFLTDLGPGLGRVITPLRLVDYNTMKRDATKPYAPAPVGMARHSSVTQNGQVTERTVEAIQILSGLPREHFAAVAAHELMHTYLFMNSFPDLPPLVEEGLCELAAYLWLRQRKSPEATYHLKLMESNTAPVYGEGFQLARRAWTGRSLLETLNHVRRTGRFP